jgi:hypothetical protein
MDAPNIPNLSLTEYDNWEGVIKLSAWQNFQSRQGAYAAQDSAIPSDGTVQLRIDNKENKQVAPSPEQVKAYQYLLANQEQIRDAMLEALLPEYEKLRDVYGYDEEEAAQYMPPVQKASDFKKLIGLSSVHIQYVHKDGVAYVGYEFGCTWDDEHGLGIMTHLQRVIEIGGADTSFLWWVADDDAKGKNP